ncbi:hypothetical protein [Bradyrhizobium sp. 5.13L]
MVPKKSCCTHAYRLGLTLGADREHVAAAGPSVAIETHAGIGIWSSLARLCIARNDHKVKDSGLPNGRNCKGAGFVLTYLHPVSFFHNETYIVGQMTKKSICSEPVFAMAREHSTSGFGHIGEIMAADVDRTDAQPDITGSVLEHKLTSTLALASRIWIRV